MALAAALEESQDAYVLDQIGRQLHRCLARQHATIVLEGVFTVKAEARAIFMAPAFNTY